MSVHLTLLHSNDLHCRLEAWTRLVTVLKAQRAAATAAGRAVLYLNAGDHGDRAFPATDATEARTDFALLAAAGCAALTAGNNEMLVWPWSVQSARAQEAPFPVLMANVRQHDGHPIPGYRDTAVLQAGPLKVGLLGLCPPFSEFLAQMNARLEPTDDAVRRCVADLKAQGVDLVVLLSHLGIHEDRRLAAAELGLDVIVGGHTHTELPEGEHYGTTLVVQAGCYGAWLGRLDLTLDPGPAGAGAQVTSWQAHLLPTADAIPDASTVAVVAAAEAQAAQILATELLTLAAPLAHDPMGPSPLAQLLADYQQRRDQADCALVMGSVLLDGLPAGPVTPGDLGRICPTMLNPCWSYVPGRLIRQWLEQSADPGVTDVPIRGAGLRGQSPMGTLFGAGITWRTDTGKPVGERISDVTIAGAPLDAAHTYKVACNDFLIFGWYGYSGGRAAGLRLDGCAVDDFLRDWLGAALLEHV